jgi:DNA-directed RNA polymerase subunit M/transcription elongation factor TFIIS
MTEKIIEAPAIDLKAPVYRFCPYCGCTLIARRIPSTIIGFEVDYKAVCINHYCLMEGPIRYSEKEALELFSNNPEKKTERPIKQWYFKERAGACIYPRKFVSKDPDDHEYVVVSTDPNTQKEIQEKVNKEGIAWIFS